MSLFIILSHYDQRPIDLILYTQRITSCKFSVLILCVQSSHFPSFLESLCVCVCMHACVCA